MRHQACEIMCQSLKNVCPSYCVYPSLFPIHEKTEHVGKRTLPYHTVVFLLKNRSITHMKYALSPHYCKFVTNLSTLQHNEDGILNSLFGSYSSTSI